MATLLLAKDAQAAFEAAIQESLQRHSLYVDVEHLLLGVLQQVNQEPLRGVFSNTSIGTIESSLSNELGMRRESPLEKSRGSSKAVNKVFADASDVAQRMNHKAVNGGHLLLAMLDMRDEPLYSVLRASSLQREFVEEYVQKHSPKDTSNARSVALVPAKPKRRSSRPAASVNRSPIPEGVMFWGGAIVLSAFFYFAMPDIFFSFWLVVVAWVISLTLHEFAHALVAYWGGDHTVREKGYLTLNPLRYTQPLLSLGLPLFFLAIGGIGLPGGAVYIERQRLRSRWWSSAVSFAGPFANMIMAVVCAAPFFLGLIETETQSFFGVFLQDPTRLEAALAFTIFLQITAIALNLLPIPPLDGFGIIEPYLDEQIVHMARSMGFFGLLLLFFVFFQIPGFSNEFFNAVQQGTDLLDVPWNWAIDGLDNFRFWRSD